MPKVFVTGMGIISAIGNNCNENLSSLSEGKTGIGKANYFESKYSEVLPFGEVKKSNQQLLDKLNIKSKKGLTRTGILAFTAFVEAIVDAQLTADEISDEETVFISASTVGGMCLTDQLYEDANLKSTGSAYINSYSCGDHTLKIVEEFNIKGHTATINTACSSSANAIMLGTRMIKAGKAKRAIVGGTDSLAKYTVNGFNALQILSEKPCMPFDENRTGLNLGEGAAYLVLEDERLTANKKKYAEVKGYGNANDAYHQSSLSDEAFGVIKSINAAIETAKIRPNEIEYINTHGTGTVNNDRTELFGITSIFDNVPIFNSTKSYTGHTLGAAGAIEAVFSILSLNNNMIPKSLNITTPIEEFNMLPNFNTIENIAITNVLSNSFGFAGNCSSLIFGKP